MFNMPIPFPISFPPPPPLHREPLSIDEKYIYLREKIEKCETDCEDKNVRRN